MDRRTLWKSCLDQPALRDIAEHAIRLCDIILKHFPLTGIEPRPLDVRSLEGWFNAAGNLYIEIERTRNPNELPFEHRRGQRFSSGPLGSHAAVGDLWDNLDLLAEHYGWQGVSDGSTHPHCDFRSGASLPPIDPFLLGKIASATRDLTESLSPLDDELLKRIGKVLSELVALQAPEPRAGTTADTKPFEPEEPIFSFIVKPIHAELVRVLDAAQTLMTNPMLEGEIREARAGIRTIQIATVLLEKHGYAERPEGKNSGWRLTAKGKLAADKLIRGAK